jgi:hypothetical protein
MPEPTQTAAVPAFPKLLRFPSIERPPEIPVATPAEVRVAGDLPTRLFLGDLVPESFLREKKGWKAEWRDADGHFTRFRYAGGLSGLELSYAGDEFVTLVSVERFTDLALSVQQISPGAWLEKLATGLEARYNLRVFPHREDDAVGADFPDGHWLTLALPVPADRLMALFDLHKRLQSDASLRAGIDAYARLHFSVVNYIEGRNHPMLAHPAGLVLHHVNALGTPAAEAPMREEDESGTVAWTLQRSHYQYIAHCHLRDLVRFVGRLAEAGFIAEPNGQASMREGWPQGAEFAAALLPYGYEYVAQNAWWFDRERRRRMFYPSFAHADDRSQLGGNSGDMWHKALIREAQKAAEFTKADTARAFAEGMAAAGGSIPPQNPASLH